MSRPLDVWCALLERAERDYRMMRRARKAIRQVLQVPDRAARDAPAAKVCLDRRSPDELAEAYLAAFERLGR